MTWKTVGRPGFFGKDKDKKHAKLDVDYGKGNWRIAWKWNKSIITRDLAYQLYEDGYYADSFNRKDVWEELVKTAKDVWDLEKKDIESKLDYHIQKGIATHLQDIAVRRVVQRRGMKFQGNELVRIRKHDEYWGNLFSPGRIPFHLSDLIESPHLESWWDYNSIEDFYQSNKILQIKTSPQNP